MAFQYFGIKTPGENGRPGYIWWIANSAYEAWNLFFTYPSKDRTYNASRAPQSDAIRAYEAIGYKCVELELKEINQPTAGDLFTDDE